MANQPLTGRALRLKEVYEESRIKSVSAFAREIGLNQPTVSNYFIGQRQPNELTMIKVHDKFPQYRKEWLLEGTGDKFDSTYVEISGNNNGVVLNGNNIGGGNTVNENIANRLSDLYERLISYMFKCNELEKQVEELKKMLKKHEEEDK